MPPRGPRASTELSWWGSKDFYCGQPHDHWEPYPDCDREMAQGAFKDTQDVVRCSAAVDSGRGPHVRGGSGACDRISGGESRLALTLQDDSGRRCSRRAASSGERSDTCARVPLPARPRCLRRTFPSCCSREIQPAAAAAPAPLGLTPALVT